MTDEDFAEFVAGSLSRLLRFGYVLTGDPEAAADLMQEALARTLRASCAPSGCHSSSSGTGAGTRSSRTPA